MEVINLGSYQIHVGSLRESLRKFIEDHSYSDIVVIVDENTRRDCLPLLRDSLSGLPFGIIEIASGEVHKNIDTCQSIWRQMMDLGLSRKSLAINLGGGVIGDMGGFCAGTFKRGIDFIQLPTTLLSQVDASIGGKLGIDFGRVKNSIGLFSDPKAVFIDPQFLASLPRREIRSGLAEIIKHSLIADADQWVRVREIKDLEAVDWLRFIGPSLQIKRRIVEADPKEQGIRKALNFGHTIGHAVESYALESDRPLLHGEAVAIGMICEAYLSHRWLGLPLASTEEIHRFLLRLYGHYPLDPSGFEDLLALMRQDKKNEGREILFSLIPAIGEVQVDCRGPSTDILEGLLFYNRQPAA